MEVGSEVKSAEWRCGAQVKKAPQILKIAPFACFLTTVLRLPYNRLPAFSPMMGHGTVYSCRERLQFPLSSKESDYGYTVNGYDGEAVKRALTTDH